jgi:hypothetical protein
VQRFASRDYQQGRSSRLQFGDNDGLEALTFTSESGSGLNAYFWGYCLRCAQRVGVEKVDTTKTSVILGNRRCLGDPRESFVGDGELEWNYGLTGATGGPKVLLSTACIACGYDDRPRVSGLFHRVTTSDHHLRSALVKRSRCKELIVRPGAAALIL